MDERLNIILISALKFKDLLSSKELFAPGEHILYAEKFHNNRVYARVNTASHVVDIYIILGVYKIAFAIALFELQDFPDPNFIVSRYFTRVIENILNL